MNPGEIAMLVGGMMLLAVLLGLLVYCVTKRRPYKGLLVVFPLAVIMIGFSSIHTFKLLGAEVELNNSYAAVQKDPENPVAKTRLATAVDKMESLVPMNKATEETAEKIALGHEALGKTDRAYAWANAAVSKDPGSSSAQTLLDRVKVTRLLPANPGKVIAPDTRSNLSNAVSELSRRPNLTAESHLTLSKAHLVLGRTNDAAKNLNHAITQNSNLVADPRFQILRQRIPR